MSEGLDFSDRAGRAVVITGIPYAMYKDPKVSRRSKCIQSVASLPVCQHGNELGQVGQPWYIHPVMPVAVSLEKHDHAQMALQPLVTCQARCLRT